MDPIEYQLMHDIQIHLLWSDGWGCKCARCREALLLAERLDRLMEEKRKNESINTTTTTKVAVQAAGDSPPFLR